MCVCVFTNTGGPWIYISGDQREYEDAVIRRETPGKIKSKQTLLRCDASRDQEGRENAVLSFVSASVPGPVRVPIIWNRMQSDIDLRAGCALLLCID